MSQKIVFIPEASASEHSEALAEVSHFGRTDMGYGNETWPYRILREPELSSELARLANAQSIGLCDAVSFQPCPAHIAQNQDRYIAVSWDLLGGHWTFNAVLDGHLNSDTADYTLNVLPNVVRTALQSLMPGFLPDQVSAILYNSIVQLDEFLCSELLVLFPDEPAGLGSSDIQHVFNDNTPNTLTALRCLGGTTLLLTLTDPPKENIWIANLSDSYAVLGLLRDKSNDWSSVQLNTIHAASNHTEADRVRSAHPHEPDVIEDGRVLGFLEPTRALGDMWLKLPAAYTRIFEEMDQDAISSEMLQEVAIRIRSPPYVSNKPDVTHRSLLPGPCFLILATDGLRSAETYATMSNDREVLGRWVTVVGGCLESDTPQNSAMVLLRDALGGIDNNSVSRHMTVEMDERWMDDVTIVVQKIR